MILCSWHALSYVHCLGSVGWLTSALEITRFCLVDQPQHAETPEQSKLHRELKVAAAAVVVAVAAAAAVQHAAVLSSRISRLLYCIVYWYCVWQIHLIYLLVVWSRQNRPVSTVLTLSICLEC